MHSHCQLQDRLAMHSFISCYSYIYTGIYMYVNVQLIGTFT